MRRIALCFPGQGSQAAGMAAGLARTSLGGRLLEVATGEGLDLETALSGDDASLRATEIAQPALVFTELVLAAALPEEFEVVGAAGHSVGEYAACAVAGAMTPETALRLVIGRGRLMAEMREGAMAAVLGLEAEAVEEVCASLTAAGQGTVVVANLNAPGQVVISGAGAAVTAATDQLKQAGAKRILPLNVSGAFHSPLMADAAARFSAVLEAAAITAGRIPVIANVDAAVVSAAQDVRQHLRRQLDSPVRWVDCVRRLAALGADALVEIGPGGVLTGLARRIVPGMTTMSVADLDAVAALSGRLGEAGRG